MELIEPTYRYILILEYYLEIGSFLTKLVCTLLNIIS